VRAGAARLSLVCAAYDEEACLPELYRRVRALPELGELIIVDDGSTDRTWEIVSALAAEDPRVRGLQLGANHGSQPALLCGLQAARGDVICTLDADLQHPPGLIPRMIQAWRDGFDVVEAVRRGADAGGAGLVRELVTPLFYRAFNAVSPVGLAPFSTDFRLLDRGCVEALRGFPGELVRAMVARLPATRTALFFDVPPRFAGRSRYGAAGLVTTAARALYGSLRARVAEPPRPVAPAAVRAVGVGLAG